MANEPVEAVVSQFAGDTQMGPVQAVDPPSLFPVSSAPGVRYALSPRERDAWQFSLDGQHQVIGECAAATDAHTADVGALDGPYDAGTVQPGLPVYGMAGG